MKFNVGDKIYFEHDSEDINKIYTISKHHYKRFELLNEDNLIEHADHRFMRDFGRLAEEDTADGYNKRNL